MSTFIYTLFVLVTGYFVRGIQQSNQKLNDYDAGFQAGYNSAWDEFDEFRQRVISLDEANRDKKEVSLEFEGYEH